MARGVSSSSANVYIDTSDLKKFARDLAKFHPAMSASLKVRVRAAADLVKEEAQRHAGYSKRIPPSLRTSVTSFGTRATVKAGGKKAPNAAPIENKGKGFVRHPLFGTREHWYNNPQPAFLAPSLEAKVEEVSEAMAEAVDDAFDAIGFK